MKKTINLIAAIFFIAFTQCVFTPQNTPKEAKEPVLKIPEDTRSKKLGKEFLREARKQFKFVKDPEVIDAVNRIGQSILTANGENSQTFHFLVVKDDTPNAFAIPGGYIFIFDGLLSKIESIDELAGVLSHEIGHVKKDHFFKEDKTANLVSIAGLVAALVARDPNAAIAGAFAAQQLHLSFSRDEEREADSVGLRLLNQAGYDPEGLYHFFKTLQAYEKYNPSLVPAYFSTHPAVEEREATMQMMVRALPKPSETATPVHLDWDRIRTLVEVENNPDKPLSELFLDPFKKGIPEERKHYLTGLAFFKNNQLQDAGSEFKKAIDMDPRQSFYHSGLAYSLFKLNDLNKAKSEASKSILLDSENGEAEMILGFIGEQEGNSADALNHYEKAKDLRQRDPLIYFKLGSLYSSMGSKKEAAWNLARYYRYEFRTEEALAELQKAREMDKRDRLYQTKIDDEIIDIFREGL